jgi:hypothetical protein
VQINLHSQWYEPLGCIAFAKCRIEPQGTENILSCVFVNTCVFVNICV